MNSLKISEIRNIIKVLFPKATKEEKKMLEVAMITACSKTIEINQ